MYFTLLDLLYSSVLLQVLFLEKGGGVEGSSVSMFSCHPPISISASFSPSLSVSISLSHTHSLSLSLSLSLSHFYKRSIGLPFLEFICFLSACLVTNPDVIFINFSLAFFANQKEKKIDVKEEEDGERDRERQTETERERQREREGGMERQRLE